ncbi:protein FAM111B-like [Dendronephthya gigantea]|uniref:protein FAM111B-like n=1 Tax=Dendronephthya gigantea TaxID=151771 RepID=UPI00106A4AE6|nr:protein FAM111B-like [Dendronephthya gigantea]XP_028406107.1 protein FAM111B-like [Dendronephthya gigantea]
MDDSGYDSPNAHGKKVHFVIKRKESNSLVNVIAASDEILADAVRRKNPNVNMKSIVFGAKLRGHDRNTAVNPFLLPCHFIQFGTEVSWQDLGDETKLYDKDPGLSSVSSCTNAKHGQAPFFVSIANQKHKENITHINRQKLGPFEDICVVANRGESFEQALIRDGRFRNVQRFTLSRKLPGVVIGCEIDKTDERDDYEENLVLEVKLAKSTNTESKSLGQNKRNCLLLTSEIASTSGETSTATTMEEEPRKYDHTSLDQLTEKLCRESGIYYYSEDFCELTASERRLEMERCLRARAMCTLLPPNERKENHLKSSLVQLVATHFSNVNIVARPVAFSKIICHFYDSVGYLKCGDVNATCFLVSQDMVVTNFHVIRQIQTARESSTPNDHSHIYVYFGYERPDQESRERYKLAPLQCEGNIVYSDAFDYAFLRTEECVEGKLTLGQFVRCNVPRSGIVSIVGHPGGKEKQEELCAILPSSHQDRMSSNDTLFMYRENCRRDLSGIALTYDVGSMFEGSSGSPVFDMNCQIVALHSMGFQIENSRLVEAGVTFNAIILDLHARGFDEFVREHLPYCFDISMDID